MSAARSPLAFALTHESPFRYTCRRCSRCCHDQRIHLNPYEVLRLARGKGVSTGEIVAAATAEGGTVLAFRDGGCVFLGPGGCTVHDGRPLACRLYPLGRFVAPNGEVRFATLPGHPESEGVFGRHEELGGGETVGRFVREQGAEPYLVAADRYYALLTELRARLVVRAASDPAIGDAEIPREEISLSDVDAWVARYASRRELTVPDDLDALLDLHIAALREWLEATG